MTKKVARFVVTLVRAGRDHEELVLSQGSTLEDALQKAGMSDAEIGAVEGSIRVGGKNADLDKKLKAEDFIVLSPKVQGGC